MSTFPILLLALPALYFNAVLMSTMVHAFGKTGVIFNPVKAFRAHWPWFKYFAALLPIGVVASILMMFAADAPWLMILGIAVIWVGVLVVSFLMHAHVLRGVASPLPWNVAIVVMVGLQLGLVVVTSLAG